MFACCLFMAVFIFTTAPLFSLGNNVSTGIGFSEIFQNAPHSHSQSKKILTSMDVPAALMRLYRKYAKQNQHVGRNSERPDTFYCYVGKGLPGNKGIIFNLSSSQIHTNKIVQSAEILVTVELRIGPIPPLFWSGHLILFDQFDCKPVYSVKIQRGGLKSISFPAHSLVKRWISSPHLNHGVYISLQGDQAMDEASFGVIFNDTSAGEYGRPLLLVRTQSKTEEEDTSFSQKRQGKKSLMSPKPRPPRSIQDQLPCSRHPMRVELRKTLRWKHVVIPQFYEAYRCAGACRFPLGTNVNPTDHAIIRATLFSAGKDKGTGKPCCVPVKLRGISAIEYRNGEFQMLYHDDMVVQQCGCR